MRMGLPWRSAGLRGVHRDGVWEGQDDYPGLRVVSLGLMIWKPYTHP